MVVALLLFVGLLPRAVAMSPAHTGVPAGDFGPPPDGFPPGGQGDTEWPAWATTDELRALAAPATFRRSGDLIDMGPAAHPGRPDWGLTDAVRARWAALPPDGPTDCPLESYTLVEVRRRSIVVEGPGARQVVVHVGEAVGGGWRTWGWRPRYTLVGVRGGGKGEPGVARLRATPEFAGEPLPGDPPATGYIASGPTRAVRAPPRRAFDWRTGELPAPLPDHPVWAPPALDGTFAQVVADRQLDAPPGPAILAALVASGPDRVSRFAVACAPGGERCVVRGDALRLDRLAAFLTESPVHAWLAEVERFEVHLPPGRPCWTDDVVHMYAFYAELDATVPRGAAPPAAHD